MTRVKVSEADIVAPCRYPERHAYLIGLRVFKTTVIGIAGLARGGVLLLRGGCDCGAKFIFRKSCLTDVKSLSCGCARKATTKPEYETWKSIRKRCSNKTCSDYRYYGARGIRVCPEWEASFEVFYQDVGPRPSPKHSLDRIDNARGYTKENVRWADQVTQTNNTRRNIYVEYHGEVRPVTLVARELGLDPVRLCAAFKRCNDLTLAIERVKKFKSRSAPPSKADYMPEKEAWKKIKSRCYDENDPNYHHYGGRGIRMSDEWRASFDRFFEDVGKRPAPGWSLDRLDNNKSYMAGNCAWRTHVDQMNNTRHTTMVTYDGVRQPLAPLCRKLGLGITAATVRRRLKAGWEDVRALTEPNLLAAQTEAKVRRGGRRKPKEDLVAR